MSFFQIQKMFVWTWWFVSVIALIIFIQIMGSAVIHGMLWKIGILEESAVMGISWIAHAIPIGMVTPMVLRFLKKDHASKISAWVLIPTTQVCTAAYMTMYM